MGAAGRQRIIYIAADYLMVTLGWLIFTALRYEIIPEASRAGSTIGTHMASSMVLAGIVLIPTMMTALYAVSGYYNNVFFKSRLDEFINTGIITTVGVIIILLAVLINDASKDRSLNYELLAILWCSLFVPVTVCRFVVTTRCTRRIRKGEIVFDTLIIGTGKRAQALAAKIASSPYSNGMEVVGLVNTRDASESLRTDVQLPIYDLEEIEDTVKRLGIKRLLVTPQHEGMVSTTQLINRLLALDCRILVTPDVYSLIVARPRLTNVAGEPLIDILAPSATHLTRNIKRISDIILSSIALVLLSPLYLLIGIAVRLDSPGPVFYRQERVGYKKRPFNILKFRSMHVDAERQGPSLSGLDDPRITRLGHFMRKYRIDELPQFWNVLKGDMSLVGPRPEREYYIRQIIKIAPYYTLLHQVRPGITSWGMVKYGYATTVEQMVERLRYDLLYIENISLTVDLKILFHTVNTVLTGKGL